MEIIKGTNLAVRFLLELCALAALGYWGFQTGRSAPSMIGLGIGTPLLAAIVWGLMVAPNASVSVPDLVRLALELVIFASVVAALIAAGETQLAWMLAIAYIVNRTLMAVWGQ